KSQLADWEQFAAENLKNVPEGAYCLFGSYLYLVPGIMTDMKGMKVLRPGLCLGENKKGRFEPSHALALALHPEEAALCHELSGQEAQEYLKGASFTSPFGKGWVLMTYMGCSLGFAKSAGGMLKNHYPKGLRK
ncbi:MAG: RsmF rRNA methyltransferase first C-terminal domain-containing protein, partial [Lachnospiraceae bacterium]